MSVHTSISFYHKLNTYKEIMSSNTISCSNKKKLIMVISKNRKSKNQHKLMNFKNAILFSQKTVTY